MQIARGLQGFFSSQIIAILAAILFPVFARAREKARQASCLANVKQISLGLLQYVQDYDERFMYYGFGSYTVSPWIFWPHQVQPYIKNWQVMDCPSNPYAGQSMTYHGMFYPNWTTYGVTSTLWQTSTGYKLAKIESPAEKYMLFDSNHPALGDVRAILTSTSCGQWSCGKNVATTHQWLVPHNDGVNIGFCDGHAKWEAGNTVWGKYSWALNPSAS